MVFVEQPLASSSSANNVDTILVDSFLILVTLIQIYKTLKKVPVRVGLLLLVYG